MKGKWVSYSLDRGIKQEAEKIIRKLGFTPSSIINVLYKKIIDKNEIPFNIVKKNKNVGYMCRIEENTKEKAEKIIKAAGMKPTYVVNMFYNEIIQCKGLPFDIELKLNKEN